MRIYLLGFMGAGKSAVGQLLSERLGVAHLDLDREIEQGEGRRIADLFSDRGEVAFRESESRYLRQTANTDNVVVALGGGTYVQPENRAWIESRGLSVWLKVSLETSKERVPVDGSRPLFVDEETVRKLFDERRLIYSRARVHISTDGRSPFQVAEDLTGILEHL